MEKKRIVVFCSPYYKTGGTELLHQLVYKINENIHFDIANKLESIYFENPNFKIKTEVSNPEVFKKQLNEIFVEGKSISLAGIENECKARSFSSKYHCFRIVMEYESAVQMFDYSIQIL